MRGQPYCFWSQGKVVRLPERTGERKKISFSVTAMNNEKLDSILRPAEQASAHFSVSQGSLAPATLDRLEPRLFTYLFLF